MFFVLVCRNFPISSCLKSISVHSAVGTTSLSHISSEYKYHDECRMGQSNGILLPCIRRFVDGSAMTGRRSVKYRDAPHGKIVQHRGMWAPHQITSERSKMQQALFLIRREVMIQINLVKVMLSSSGHECRVRRANKIYSSLLATSDENLLWRSTIYF